MDSFSGGLQWEAPVTAAQAFYLDGITEERLKALSRDHLNTAGDWAPLVGGSGRTWGAVRPEEGRPWAAYLPESGKRMRGVT